MKARLYPMSGAGGRGQVFANGAPLDQNVEIALWEWYQRKVSGGGSDDRA